MRVLEGEDTGRVFYFALCWPGDAGMLNNYLPILIFLVVATVVALVMLTLGTLIGRFFSRNPADREKLSAYECGFEAFEDSRMKFDVRYYLVAILFIVFDLEVVFLFPWAVALGKIGVAGLIAMVIFLGILTVGASKVVAVPGDIVY
jgi:NADH-quinone oxidoreductase subunit A